MRDWNEKRAALSALWGTFTLNELARKVLGPKYGVDSQENLADAMRKWDNSEKTVLRGAGSLFKDELTKRFQEMGSTAINISGIIVHGTVKEFQELIDAIQRSKAQLSEQVANDVYSPMFFPHSAPPIRSEFALLNGKVDQKYHYLSPDSASLWRDVVDSGSYRQYDDCRNALDLLCRSEIWTNFFSSGKADGAVMLGGGSSSKDLLLIDSMLTLMPNGGRANYALIDYSPFMLDSSMRSIESTLINQLQRVRVSLFPIKEDFLTLRDASPHIRRPMKSVAWMLPGGTLGNLDEPRLFRSVANVSEVNDLFVVGVETINERERDSTESTLIGKYDSRAVRRFVESPLRYIWHELNSTVDLKTAIDNVKIRTVDGSKNPHSAVPGSITLEISIEANKKKIVLATSTRYDESHLIDLAEEHGFIHKLSIASPLNGKFKQLVFQFQGKGA